MGMRIKPYLVPCSGEALQSCMLAQFNETGEFGYFYDGIEQFNFEWGYDYEGAVESRPVPNPPADGGAWVYELSGAMQRTPVAAGTEFELPLGPIVGSSEALGQVVSGDCPSGYTLFEGTHPKELSFDAGVSCESFRTMLATEIPDAIRLRFSSPDAPLGVVNVVSPSIVRMEIKPFLEPCVGVGAMACLLVRSNGSVDFDLLYGGIEGFDFEWGYQQWLWVKTTELAIPPQDGSSIAYTMVERTKKVAVVPGTEFDFTLTPRISTMTEFVQVVSGDCTSGYALFFGERSKALVFDAGMSCDQFRTLVGDAVPGAIRLRFSNPQEPLSVVGISPR